MNMSDLRRHSKMWLDVVRDDMGRKAISAREKAIVLASHFKKVHIRDGSPTSDGIPHTPADRDCMPPVVFGKVRVKRLLRRFDALKAPGMDDIHPDMVRALASTLSAPLAALYQES